MDILAKFATTSKNRLMIFPASSKVYLAEEAEEEKRLARLVEK